MPAEKVRPQPHTEYHRDGSVRAKGMTLDGSPTGYWGWFRKDGTRLRSGTFEDGQQVGEWPTYYRAGQVYKVTVMKPKKKEAQLESDPRKNVPHYLGIERKQSVGSRLIIVEGLTGSGKSITAHFVARQLNYNGIASTWLHEGELSHPILIDLDDSIESYVARSRGNWAAFVDQAGSSQVRIIEGCFFNNLLETLWAHGVEPSKIVQFAAELQAYSEPLDPALVYLVQEDAEQALLRNFANRGAGFRNFVIDLATSTPLAKDRGWEGYAGMVRYWQAFVAFTDELFDRFPYRKVKIDNTAGNWDDHNRQVLDCLAIPMVPEGTVSPSEARGLVGLYEDRRSGREFAVYYEDGALTVNLFLDVRTRLVLGAGEGFMAEGWHFEVCFGPGGLSGASLIRIGGRDVDYLRLVGTVAEKVGT